MPVGGREFRPGPAALQVAGAQVGRERQGEGLGEAEAVAAQGDVVAEEPGGVLPPLGGGDHGLDEVVVAVRLVDEARARRRDRDDAGLRAVHEVREGADACRPARAPARPEPRRRRWGSGPRSRRPRPRRGAVRRRCWRAAPATSARRRSARGGTGRGAARRRAGSRRPRAPRRAARAHARSAALALHQRAAHRAVLDHQLARRGRGPERDAEIEGRLRQAPDQRVAVGQPHGAAVPQHVARVPRQQSGDHGRRAGGAGGVEEVHQLLAGADHHPEEGDLAERRAQPGLLGAERAGVEGLGADGAAAGGAAGRVRVVVGEEGAEHEAQRGFALEEIDHGRAVAEEGVHALPVEVVAGLVAEVGARRLDAVRDALAPRGRAARYPEPAAGARGGAAVEGVLLHEQHVEAELARGDRRRQAAGAGADDQHVAVVDVHPRPPASAATDGRGGPGERQRGARRPRRCMPGQPARILKRSGSTGGLFGLAGVDGGNA